VKLFNNILFLADSTGDLQPGFERALSLAQSNQAQLTVLSVLQPLPPSVVQAYGYGLPTDLALRLQQERMAALEALVAPARQQVALELKVLQGEMLIEVVRLVLSHGHDLLLKTATEETTLTHRLLGSADMQLLRKCPCPVWLLKPSAPRNHRRVLAAVEFEPAAHRPEAVLLNREILTLAASIAMAEFAELHVVHVWDAIAESLLRVWGSDPTPANLAAYVNGERKLHEAGLQHLMGDLRGHIGPEAFDYLAPRLHLPRGAARSTVPSLAQELAVDLIVMGTVGRTGIPGLLIGNTAETILEQIDCSVLAIKPPGFISPVTPFE